MYWDNLAQVAGADFTFTSGSMADVTGLSFAALANSKYEVETVLICQSSNSGGMEACLAYSAALATGGWVAFGHNASAGSNHDGGALGSSPGNVNFITTATTTQVLIVRGTVVTGANAGNITTQVLKAGGGTGTIYISSIQKVRKIG